MGAVVGSNWYWSLSGSCVKRGRGAHKFRATHYLEKQAQASDVVPTTPGFWGEGPGEIGLNKRRSEKFLRIGITAQKALRISAKNLPSTRVLKALELVKQPPGSATSRKYLIHLLADSLTA